VTGQSLTGLLIQRQFFPIVFLRGEKDQQPEAVKADSPVKASPATAKTRPGRSLSVRSR
jgi:hypothetical protein